MIYVISMGRISLYVHGIIFKKFVAVKNLFKNFSISWICNKTGKLLHYKLKFQSFKLFFIKEKKW